MYNETNSVGVRGIVGGVIEKKELEIEREFNRVREVAGQLHKTIDILRGRLAPVMTSQLKEDSPKPQEVEPSTGLGAEIRGVQYSIRDANEKISDLISCIQL